VVVQGQLEERAEAAKLQRAGLEVEVEGRRAQLQGLQQVLDSRNAELGAAERANEGLKREVRCVTPPACRIPSHATAPCGPCCTELPSR
jgi:hypothetical protein